MACFLGKRNIGVGAQCSGFRNTQIEDPHYGNPLNGVANKMQGKIIVPAGSGWLKMGKMLKHLLYGNRYVIRP